MLYEFRVKNQTKQVSVPRSIEECIMPGLCYRELTAFVVVTDNKLNRGPRAGRRLSADLPVPFNQDITDREGGDSPPRIFLRHPPKIMLTLP